ncbi:MAG: hypothetical protein OHK0039_02640 [Bacteroidia bacterium]
MGVIKYCHIFGLLTCTLLLSTAAQAQAKWVPGDYFGVSERDKQTAFFDEFDDNRYKWDLGSSFLNERIYNGDFYCASLTALPYQKRRDVPLDQSNYELEIRMRYVKGDENSGMGLVFGRDIRGNEYFFQFNALGYYRIGKVDRSKTYEFQSWKPCPQLTRHSYNALTLRRVGPTWYFFINQKLITSMDAMPFFGSEAGFTVGGYSAVEVDYLRVSELRHIDQQGPQISFYEPEVTTNRHLRFSERKQIIRGRVYDVSGVSEVKINDQPISVSAEGGFSALLTLPDGVHAIRVQASDVYGNRTEELFHMEYLSSEADQGVVVQSADHVAPSRTDYNTTGGKNYILLIGINNYTEWTPLHNAVKDCQDLSETLTTYYQFERENIITLFNEDATRENILETLDRLQKTLTEHDNLLIYYAGHGYYDQSAEQGFWIPVNARLNRTPDFIRNSTIHDYLRAIDSRHTLLIADACYAGSLFAQDRGNLSEDARSRWAFTSGNIEKVWDGQPGQNSPFARSLIRYLKTYNKPKLYADELIDSVGPMVQRLTAQNPQGSPLRLAGDNGGVFTFYHR